jgi:coenzyme F420-reducing hydrogenase delta subunit
MTEQMVEMRSRLAHIRPEEDQRLVEEKDAELTQTQEEAARLGTALADACAARDALVQERNDAKEEAAVWFDETMKHGGKLRQARTELAQRQESQAYTDGILRKTNNELADALTKVKAAIGGLHAELADTCDAHDVLAKKLKDLQGASRVLEQHVAWVKKNRDYWYDKAMDAEASRDKMRKIAQAQSDELTQARDELAAVDKELGEFYCPVLDENDQPCGSFYKDHGVNVMRQAMKMAEHVAAESGLEVERLKKQLGRAAATQAAIVEAAETLTMRLRRRLQYKAELNTLEETLMHKSKAAVKLLERLATLDAAEAALASCGISGIFAEFDGLADTINQMAQHIKELASRLAQAQADLEAEPIEVEITGQEMVEALQHERAQRQVAETGERAARKMLAHERQLRQEAAETVPVPGQMQEYIEYLIEHLQAVQTGRQAAKKTLERERQLRQEAEQDIIEMKIALSARELAAQIREALDDSQA